jgi:hypothetical protein
MTISREIINMLETHQEINDLSDLIHDKFVDTTDDWIDIKHMPIDETCTEMDLDNIKKIVKEYGVLEIMDLIKNNYGDEFITSIMEKTMDMRYRTLFYHILDEYIDYVKDTYHWDDEDTDEDSDDNDEDYDSDEVSDAETEPSDETDDDEDDMAMQLEEIDENTQNARNWLQERLRQIESGEIRVVNY